jgi:hypothetical protein
MVNGRAVASGEKGMDLSEGIAWFGNILNFSDILNMDAPLVEVGPRSFLAIRRSVDGSSQRGRVCARPDPAGGAGAKELWPAASECEAEELAGIEKRQYKGLFPNGIKTAITSSDITP